MISRFGVKPEEDQVEQPRPDFCRRGSKCKNALILHHSIKIVREILFRESTKSLGIIYINLTIFGILLLVLDSALSTLAFFEKPG